MQVEFFAANGLRVFDPIKKRNLIEKEIFEKKISSKFIINRFSRIRFCAKVALSAGYFVFGEWFRENVVHHELRALMNLESSPNAVDFENFQTTICEELSLPSVADRNQFAMEEMFCKFVNGSCVYFVPSKSSLLVSVGILGKYIATLNVPANTENFPFSCENDIGHAILLENGKMERISYRQFAKRTYDKLQMMKSS